MLKAPIFYYSHLPICLMLLVNTIFFIMTIRSIHQANSESANATSNSNSSQSRTNQRYVHLKLLTIKHLYQTALLLYRIRVMITLFILKGIPWVSEVITFHTEVSFYISVIPDSINVLTGVFIFVLFVCKPSVIKLLKKRGLV